MAAAAEAEEERRLVHIHVTDCVLQGPAKGATGVYLNAKLVSPDGRDIPDKIYGPVASSGAAGPEVRPSRGLQTHGALRRAAPPRAMPHPFFCALGRSRASHIMSDGPLPLPCRHILSFRHLAKHGAVQMLGTLGTKYRLRTDALPAVSLHLKQKNFGRSDQCCQECRQHKSCC